MTDPTLVFLMVDGEQVGDYETHSVPRVGDAIDFAVVVAAEFDHLWADNLEGRVEGRVDRVLWRVTHTHTFEPKLRVSAEVWLEAGAKVWPEPGAA